MTDNENNRYSGPNLSNASHDGDIQTVISPSTQMYNDLRRRIIDLELKPSSVLSRVKLAEYYNVSQSPLREALQILERDGLITVHPQSKTLVSLINVQQVYETQFLRVALEIEVCSRLAQQDSSELVKRANILIRMQEACVEDSSQTDLFYTMDKAFHTCLFEAVGMESLNKLLIGKLGHLARCQRLELPKTGRMQDVIQAHKDILAAIESGDSSKAGAAARKHLTGTISRIANLQREYPEYFTDTL